MPRRHKARCRNPGKWFRKKRQIRKIKLTCLANWSRQLTDQGVK